MIWVTRERPKIDRLACPWLIARFVDPEPVFRFVPPDRVLAVAVEEGGVAYDVPGVELTHVGERCSFDAIVAKYALDAPGLERLAAVVRGADTDRLDLAPECAGLLAISVGLGRVFTDDQDVLRHALVLYDALFAWCRDAPERHGWAGPV